MDFVTILALIGASSGITIAIVLCSALCVVITVILYCTYGQNVMEWQWKLIKTVFVSIFWAIWDTLVMFYTVISSILALPPPFNLLAILASVLVFILGVTAFIFVGYLHGVKNIVVNSEVIDKACVGLAHVPHVA